MPKTSSSVSSLAAESISNGFIKCMHSKCGDMVINSTLSIYLKYFLFMIDVTSGQTLQVCTQTLHKYLRQSV